MDVIRFCNRIITLSFYTLFLLVPMIFAGNTSELFELNKMWVTFGLTTIIMAAWISKMILQKQFAVQKTPLDWFVLAFLLSQVLSSIFSLDARVSFWGYYSRFNGGLLSMISYVLLYYAYVSHFDKKQTFRFLSVVLFSGLLVAAWGLPSHFGYDPTCYLFRGHLDVTCWTDAFRPTTRIFSTLGQPAWLAAFVAALLPLAITRILQFLALKQRTSAQTLRAAFYGVLTLLLYLCLLFANTKAGFMAFWIGNALFWIVIFYKRYLSKQLFLYTFVGITGAFFLCNFFFGTPIQQLNAFSYSSLTAKSAPPTTSTPAKKPATPAAPADAYDPNITDSGDIRLYVWQGAIAAWKDNFLFGTGVETFAFAYYKYRPVGHNLTSEWDFLYNKAHNEYLNYLTTTGFLGLGTYLTIIGVFLYVIAKKFWQEKLPQTQLSGVVQNAPPTHNESLLVVALSSAFVTILVSNFFGFSVVIINLFFFIFPACALIVGNMLPNYHYRYPKTQEQGEHVTVTQWISSSIVVAFAIYLLLQLFNFWNADVAYALGSNLDHAGEFQTAYPLLQQAATMVPAEPVYKDELSYNSAQMAVGLYQAQQATPAAQLAQQAIAMNDEVLSNHPNNIVFWKTRIRIFYTLSQLDQRYLPYAIKAGEQAVALAPTDAKVHWNLGVLYGQNGDSQKAIETLEKTIDLKPDYIDAYYALGLFYHDNGVDAKGKVTNQANVDKGIKTMQYILSKMDPNNEQAKKALEQWGVSQ